MRTRSKSQGPSLYQTTGKSDGRSRRRSSSDQFGLRNGLRLVLIIANDDDQHFSGVSGDTGQPFARGGRGFATRIDAVHVRSRLYQACTILSFFFFAPDFGDIQGRQFISAQHVLKPEECVILALFLATQVMNRWNCKFGHAPDSSLDTSRFPKRKFRCDCPTTAIAHPCTLRKVQAIENEDNHYGQNFRNKFCRCGRKYNAQTELEAMIQCLACEVR